MAVLGGLLIIFSIPSALFFGIAGIVYDRSRVLAGIVTFIAGALLLFYICTIGIRIFCV